MDYCSICNQKISDCKKADKKLIKLYNSKYKIRYLIPSTLLNRFEKAISYTCGAYKREFSWRRLGYVETFYNPYDNTRTFLDTFLTMPLCVFEENSSEYLPVLLHVIKENVESLPMPQKYIQLLSNSPNVGEYLSSLQAGYNRL